MADPDVLGRNGALWEFIKDFRTKKPRSDLTDTELKRAYEKGLRVDDVGVPRVSTDTGVVSGKVTISTFVCR